MPFPNGDPKPGEPGYTGYISPENGGKAGVNQSDPNAPPDPHAHDVINAKVQPTPYGGFDVALDKIFGGTGLGMLPKQATSQTPGVQLDTSQADAERSVMGTLLGHLQQQAATGGGEWEQGLKAATDKAGAAAQAIGQSQPGGNYQSQLRDISNAQGGAAQRAVGQGNILRAQTQQDAKDQIAALSGGMGSQDLAQSADTAAVLQGKRELNNTIASNAGKQAGANIQGGVQAIGTLAALSDGGKVPGRPEVFGDDQKNDTVRAMLSPGEIVIPRSHSGSPEAAADFVRALQAKKGGGGPQHFAEGGQTAEGQKIDDSGLAGGFYAPGGVEKPSLENGGLLNTTNYDQSRRATLVNAASGPGQSVAPQQMQNAADANLAAAMQAQAAGRGAPGDLAQVTGQAVQNAGGQAATTVAREQSAGSLALAHALMAQRARDLSMAQARQQAAFRNTQINAGLGLDQQQQLRSILGGVGQAAVSASNLNGGKFDESDDIGKSSVFDTSSAAADKAFDSTDWPEASGGSSSGGAADLHGYGDDKWAGGEIEDTRAADFVAALRRRKSA